MLPAHDVQPVSMPPPDFNVYANALSRVVPWPLCDLPPRVYVPNSGGDTVDVINPLTFQVIDHFAAGAIPHHIAPAWDLSALHVENEGSERLAWVASHSRIP